MPSPLSRRLSRVHLRVVGQFGLGRRPLVRRNATDARIRVVPTPKMILAKQRAGGQPRRTPLALWARPKVRLVEVRHAGRRKNIAAVVRLQMPELGDGRPTRLRCMSSALPVLSQCLVPTWAP